MAAGNQGNRAESSPAGPRFGSIATKAVFWLTLCAMAGGFAALILVSYRDYVDQSHVYGTWIEIGTPPYQTDVLTLNDQGVFRNGRMVSTQFEFDGKTISIKTGGGVSLYQMAGTPNSPQLKRLKPDLPAQRLIKQGYEHTVSDEQVGGQVRRAALSEHFSAE